MPPLWQLRDEREALLKQRAELEKLKPSPMQQMEQTMFRDPPELLKEYANKGTLKIRTPLLADHAWDLGPEGKKESGLTPDELAKVTDIYRESQKRTESRVRKIYIEMGGDVSTANTLAPNALLNEISNKCPKGADDDAVRLLAKERAALIPRGSSGNLPAILGAFRVMMEEEDLLFDALEQLLGASRAERFVNGPHVPRSVSKWSAGPGAQ